MSCQNPNRLSKICEIVLSPRRCSSTSSLEVLITLALFHRQIFLIVKSRVGTGQVTPARHILCFFKSKRYWLFYGRRDVMKRLLRKDTVESELYKEPRRNPKRKHPIEKFGLVASRSGRGPSGGNGQCAECGGEVKVLVSPKRNPHSSKLGRAVSLKDHDLCRRCWRKLMHQQRHAGVFTLPLSMFIGGKKLHPRLLIPRLASLPKEAS